MGQTSRRLRALAAGGAVLGIGATMTLAAWSDVEIFEGTFQAGSFGLEGSADGIVWDNHTDTPLGLAFTGSDNLVPGVAVYEKYHLKNIGTIPTPVTYSAATQGALDLDTDLIYRLVSSEAESCDAEAMETGNEIAAGAEFTLEVGATQSYCIEVELADSYDETQAEQGRLIWTFDAVQKPE